MPKDLNGLFNLLQKKFRGLNYDFYHLYKSLVYFVEADMDPMPMMIEKIDWKKVKEFFIKETKKFF